MIGEALDSQNSYTPKLVGSQGEEIELPSSVIQALRQLVHYLAHDQAVAVLPINKELSTQEAADILNVSRPYLVKLLEEGRIPFTRAGTHRRVAIADLLVYKMQFENARKETLDELTQLSEDMGLYAK